MGGKRKRDVKDQKKEVAKGVPGVWGTFAPLRVDAQHLRTDACSAKT